MIQNKDLNEEDLSKKEEFKNEKSKQVLRIVKKYQWLGVGLLALAVIIAFLLIIFMLMQQQNRTNGSNAKSTNSNNNIHTAEAKEFRFQRLPFDTKDIGSISPIGEFSGINRQSAPNSHMYGNYRHYIFSKRPGEYAYNVYAPADGIITGFRHEAQTKQFRFNFQINDNSFYYLDHIQTLSPEILKKLAPHFNNPLRYTQAVEIVRPGIKVKAGDILGQTGLKGIAWDWGVIDKNYCQDIIHPEHYAQDSCPRSAYDFMPVDMKADIAPLAGYWAAPPSGFGLQAVKTSPVLGQYAHDKTGTLSGGWFEVSSSWRNAFFVPDSYEPNALQVRLAVPGLSVFGVWNRISIGVGNVNPDPRLVNSKTGIVSYVLSRTNARDNNEYGVLLVRVNDNETITIETHASLTAPPSNPSFSNNAITLKR